MDITGRLEDDARDTAALGAPLLQPQAVIPGTGGPDQLRGTRQADQINARGGDDVVRGLQGNDVLNGGGGSDDLRGGSGRDVLRGGAGSDDLEGGRGADRLEGGPGRDVLDGQAGRDVMIGGGGDDVFAYTQLSGGVDRIIGFSEGADRFDLSAILPGFAASDDLSAFVSLDVVARGTNLSVDPDGGGDFQRIARLDGVSISSLSAHDLGLPSAPTVVSVGSGGQPGNGTSFVPSLSADGDFITFSTAATNLLGADNTNDFDVVLKNLETGAFTLVSNGDPGNGDTGDLSALSADGDAVVYRGFGTSALFFGEDGFAGDEPSISGDGSRVAFSSGGSVLVTESAGGAPIPIGDGGDPDISPDGGWVAYVGGGGNVLLERADGSSPTPISLGAGTAPAVSENGRFVAFEDAAGQIVRAGISGGAVAGTEVVSQSGGNAGDEQSFTPSISDDGRFVAFRSAAGNLVVGDDNGTPDIFVRDMGGDQILRFEITGDTSGVAFTWLAEPSLAGNGDFVAYTDQVSINEAGGLASGQVVVAPVDFGSGALQVADLLSSEAEPLGNAASGSAAAPAASGADAAAAAAASLQLSAPAADLAALVVPPDAA